MRTVVATNMFRALPEVQYYLNSCPMIEYVDGLANELGLRYLQAAMEGKWPLKKVMEDLDLPYVLRRVSADVAAVGLIALARKMEPAVFLEVLPKTKGETTEWLKRLAPIPVGMMKQDTLHWLTRNALLVNQELFLSHVLPFFDRRGRELETPMDLSIDTVLANSEARRITELREQDNIRNQMVEYPPRLNTGRNAGASVLAAAAHQLAQHMEFNNVAAPRRTLTEGRIFNPEARRFEYLPMLTERLLIYGIEPNPMLREQDLDALGRELHNCLRRDHPQYGSAYWMNRMEQSGEHILALSEGGTVFAAATVNAGYNAIVMLEGSRRHYANGSLPAHKAEKANRAVSEWMARARHAIGRGRQDTIAFNGHAPTYMAHDELDQRLAEYDRQRMTHF